MKPRFKKVFRDLLGNKGRTVIVVLAIAVGVFAFGSVFISQEMLLKNINDSYKASNPSTVTILIPEFDTTLVEWIKRKPGVKDADAKAAQTAKVQINEREEIITLIAVPDFADLKLGLLIPTKGDWPPGKGEIVLERNSYKGTKINLGENINIKVKGEKVYELYVSGVVYDNAAIPYTFTKQLNSFVSWETMSSLGYPKKFNRLEIATDESIKTLEDAQEMTNNITAELKDRGVAVAGTQIMKPNQHWATDNSKAFTAILSGIGAFSLILSGFLVVNTISAILTQQKKQIGIMKAIGARQNQIITLYLLMVGFYGVLSLFVALPIGMLLGYGFLKLISDLLNLDINSFYLPPSVFLMQLAAALVIPILAAIFPIIQGARRSVRLSITDFPSSNKATVFDRLLSKISGLSRPILLSLRNVFRKKGRLSLTLGTLVVAGALFMAVINVRTGMYKELDRLLSMYDFQVSISLPQDYDVDSIESRINTIPEVSAIEARTRVGAQYLKPNGTKGMEFGLAGLPPDTLFSHPNILSGSWLSDEAKDEIVLTSGFTRNNPGIKPGDTIDFLVGNDEYSLNVVGVIAMSGGSDGSSENFASFHTVSTIKDKPNLASSFLVKATPEDALTQDMVANAIEEKLDSAGIPVAFKMTKNEIIESNALMFNFMIFFLLAMAVMVALVGGLGLAGTMSLNVMDRTREIGIMRSIGANDGAIRKLVLIEGLFIGSLSFIIAIPISIPLTFGFCYAIGNPFFGRTLTVAVVPLGMLIWLLIVVAIAVIASLIPARNASKMSISETLTYE